MSYTPISVSETHQKIQSGWSPYVLDVRTAEEAAAASLDFADRLHPFERVAEIAEELPRDRDLLIHCRRGGRSAKACETLAALGFTRLFNLEGGITDWAAEIDPSLQVI